METSPSEPTPSASGAPVDVKLLLIGNQSVGKSSLLLRFYNEAWIPEDEAMATVGVVPSVHKMEVNGRRVKLNVWDTSGQDRFRTITSACYRGAQGIILVYDVASRETFEALPGWIAEIDTHLPTMVPKIIVGNKIDMEHSRQVSTEEGAAFAVGQEALFVEASAKTAVGVREVFADLVKKILDTPALWAPETARAVRDGNIELAGERPRGGRSGRCAC